jgi:hypothetical protein
MPWWEIGPAYNQSLIQSYPLAGAFHEPRIFVYPVSEYVQMVPDVGGIVDELKTIINSSGAPMPENLPFLPAFNAAQIFHSNEQVIQFQSGTGIRFLTQYAQAPYPVNNNSLFYTFQGLTSDGTFTLQPFCRSTPLFYPRMEILKHRSQRTVFPLIGKTLRTRRSILNW